MVIQWGPIALGYLMTTLALIAEHVALWGQPWRLEEPWNYVVGVLTILIGCGVWASTVRGPIHPDEAWVSTALIASSGKWIMLAYYLRGRVARHKQAAELRGQKRGEIVGGAKGLISELLEDAPDAAHDSRRHN